ncbi:MAG: putative beta-propeller-type glycoside hydrolase [Verrucomicrobia bacterium]|jgi:putative membrane-bound dehydrogenase-like protein|nr:putative beta-propeller-type glycoside hydrolase [Verrucomicrobiota bacterium]
MKTSTATLVIATLALAFNLSAAEPELTAQDLPRLKPTEPADVMKTFTVRPGFRLELVAHEPLLVSPVAISFDENGRMFVVEMIDYSERRDEKLSRIKLLEDTNGDGKFDKSTIFAKDLPWATGVICANGGIFVTASPDLIWFKDTNGDGQADERKVIFTGFGEGIARLNMQALPNSMHWGLDNRIHGATGPNGGVLRNLARPNDAPLNVSRRDFYFNTTTLELFAEAGGGQNGLSFDSNGRRYATSNSRHLMAYLFDSKYASRNPNYLMPNPLVDIPVDGPAAEVYRTSPDEAWRIIRTKWRVDGTVKGVVEGGGRASGYFTGATGVTIYRGNAYPPEFQENAFIGDAGSNLVHRKRIRPDGAGLIAERAADEQKSEFIASTDNWFRPVNFANAPDGCLYIVDMYREVIEHPWSIPESIKKFVDLNSGNDRGRIYRVVPDGFQQPKLPALSKATTQELVATLAHPNGWHRDTAARLLFEQQDKTATPLLEQLLKESKSAYGRMHALYALQGQGTLNSTIVLQAMKDSDALVRAHAVKLSEKLLKPPASNLLPEALTKLANDPDITVRYQVAFALGELNPTNRRPALLALAKQDGADKWMRVALLNSMPPAVEPLLAKAFKDGSFHKSAAGRAFLPELLSLAGAKMEFRGASESLAALEKIGAPDAYVYVRALGEGAKRSGYTLAKVDQNQYLTKIFSAAAKDATRADLPDASRIEAIQALAFNPQDSAELLASLLKRENSTAIQLAALAALDGKQSHYMPGSLLKQWDQLTQPARGSAAELLLKRTEYHQDLLAALETGKIKPHEISAAQVKRLREQRDPALKGRAEKLFAQSNTPKRDDVIKAFEPALKLKGDAKQGKLIYAERCVSCHRAEGEGHALGPDIVTVKTTGREKLLVNILDPNREVPPQFLSYAIDTRDGESYSGLVVNESPSNVTLRMAFGQETTVTRSNIVKMNSNGQSLMPEGLEAGLTPQDLANLLEFIVMANK